MKPIKVTQNNAKQIFDYLCSANAIGKRRTTITSSQEIIDIAVAKEKILDDLGLLKSERRDISAVHTTGYKFDKWVLNTRRSRYVVSDPMEVSVVEMRRRPTGWFLVSVSKDILHHTTEPPSWVVLPKDLDKKVVSRMRLKHGWMVSTEMDISADVN